MGKTGNFIKITTNKAGLAYNKTMYGFKSGLYGIATAILLVMAALSKAAPAVGAVIGLYAYSYIVFGKLSVFGFLKSFGYLMGHTNTIWVFLMCVTGFAILFKLLTKVLYNAAADLHYAIHSTRRNSEDAMEKNRRKIAEGNLVLTYGSEDNYFEAEMQRFMQGTNYIPR